jgi:hypothetical protein
MTAGFMDQAYKALEQLGGLELESEYPYVAKKEKTCNFNKTMSHVQVSGAVDLPKNETAMAQWLVENGPISIGKFPTYFFLVRLKSIVRRQLIFYFVFLIFEASPLKLDNF